MITEVTCTTLGEIYPLTITHDTSRRTHLMIEVAWRPLPLATPVVAAVPLHPSHDATVWLVPVRPDGSRHSASVCC